MVVKVTPATSVTFFRPEFNDFLYAAIGADRNDMPVSVLSALARLDVDPWEEAAELAELPKDAATRRLALLIARLPAGRWAKTDLRAIADRLVGLLPRRGNLKVPLVGKPTVLREMTGSTVAKILICTALVVTALIFVAASREPRSHDDQADAPIFGTASPPQTSTPSSR